MIKVYLASPFDAERRKDMDNAIDTLDNKLAFVEEAGNEGIYAGGKFY